MAKKPASQKKTRSKQQSGGSGKKTAPPAQRDDAAPPEDAKDRVSGGQERSDFPVVGIGASAGGFEAFLRFLAAMPPEPGLAFVLIQHLDPTHESLASELLAHHTNMQVAQAVDGERVEPDHVYVIPPNRSLAIEDGLLRLTEPDEPRGLRMPIDFFLRSLAKSCQERAIAVILSGTGTDGTLASCDVPTIFLDRSFRLRRFTPATSRLLRVLDTDLGRPLADFAFSFDDKNLLGDCQSVLETLAPADREVQDNQQRWYVRRVVPYRTQDDRIDGVVITFADVTRQKNDAQRLKKAADELEQRVRERTAELQGLNNTLRASQQRFQALMESAPDAMIVVNVAGKIEQANVRAEELFGFSRQELQDQPLTNLVPDLAEERRHGWPFAISDDSQSLGVGKRLFGVRKDGSPFPVDLQIRNLDMPHGRSMVIAVRDMTERQRAADSRSQLAAIMEGATAAIVVTSPEGQIEHWNRGAERLFGYSMAEALGKNISMLAPANRPDEFQRVLRQLDVEQWSQEYESVQVGQGGILVDVDIALSLVRDEEGKVRGVCCMIRDIRDRKRLEQRLADATEKERQRLGRELHDSLSQQVSGIGLLLATLKGKLSNGEKIDMVERLEGAVDQLKMQMRSLVKGLFPVDIDVRGLRVALQDLAQEIAQNHGVACRFECATDVDVADNFTATQLYTIAREAAYNAIQHAQASEMVVTLKEAADGVEVSVRDDGRGIPPNTEHKNGMGVRIMRHRCGLINGILTIKPNNNQGTVVLCQVSRSPSK